jgi:diguanylate cyclase (GGDEF)-like protein
MEETLGVRGNCPVGHDQCPLQAEIVNLREECKRLAEQAQIDPLTGLYNFRHLLSALEKEMERTRRTGLASSLVLADLDHFKQINDTYGHQAGNRCLQWVSRVWRSNIRRIDIACRYGGEEFAFILPGTPLIASIHTAERLRAIVAASPIDLNGTPVTLTASFGVDNYTPLEDLSPDALLERTDRYLLEAKAEGRNRVCHRPVDLAKPMTQVSAEERAMLFVKRCSQTKP